MKKIQHEDNYIRKEVLRENKEKPFLYIRE